METLFVFRQNLIDIFKKYEKITMFFIKFVVGIVVYSQILSGQNASGVFNKLESGVTGTAYMLILALCFALLPNTINLLLMIVNIGITLSAMPVVSGFIVFVLLCIIVFYARLAPHESFLMLATVIAFYLKIPYLLPIIAGLYFSLTSFIPIILGCFLWALIGSVHNIVPLMQTPNVMALDIIQKFIYTNKTIIGFCFTGTHFVEFSIVFTIVFMAVFFICKSTIDYAREISIAVATGISFFAFIFIKLAIDDTFAIAISLVMIVVSGVIAYVIKFFDVMLDYENSEKVFFQDDENYYYVKVVPKIKID